MCYYLIQIWYYWEEKIEVSVLWYADLVVASAGDDKKISLWRINGTSLGTVPVAGKDGGDSAEVDSFLHSLQCCFCCISYSLTVTAFFFFLLDHLQ